MKTNKTLLPLIISTFFLGACGSQGGNASTDSSIQNSNASSLSSEEKISDPLEAFKALKAKKTNYTLQVEDYGGDFNLFYMEDAFYVTYEDDDAYDGYLQDDQGVYPFSVTSTGKTTFGYYYYDSEADDNLKKLYDGLYCLADAAFDESLYKYSYVRNAYLLNTIDSDEGEVLFDVCGYDASSTTSGAALSDVKSIRLGVDDITCDPQIIIEFNGKTSSRGTTTVTIVDVGSTSLDERISKYLKDGTQAKQRVPSTDKFFSWLNELANINNFTLEVESKYTSSGSTNYTLTSKYTSTAYYSYTDRANEEDLGYLYQDGAIYSLYFDDINENYIKGSKIELSSTPTSLYSYVKSFADFAYYPASMEARKDGEKYIIEDEDYLLGVFDLIDETLYRFQLTNVELAKEDYGYLFTFNLYDGETIEMKVKDIGTTTLGSYK